jgi:acyl-homoserine-lactone acylase
MKGTFAAVAALVVLCVPAAAAAKGRYHAEIRRTTGGVAHIKADDFGSLGFGYGYAYAQDQICELADIVTTVNAQRSRFFGATQDNLSSDFYYQRIIDERTVQRLARRPAPDGPMKATRDTVRGFAAGVNAYLRKTGVAHIPDPTCGGKKWVRRITTLDLWRRFYQLGLRASAGNFLQQLVDAAPPTGAAASAARLPSAQTVASRLAGDPVLGGPDQLGSNGVAVGSQGARGARSVLLGNPHFPWRGSERWYEVHLTVPGKLDATGVALQAVPVVNIGFNKHVAWTHTVSTGRRFTPYELKLVPGRPTSYELDGKPVAMTTRTVHVRLADGSTRSHTFYETKWGPVVDYPAALLTWDTSHAYALADVNADEFRLVNQWLLYDKARSVRGLRRANAKVQGNPWTNTIAVDDGGRAYYGDESVTPNVSPSLQKSCSTSPKAPLLLNAGSVILLDGSRSSCRWGNDSDAVAKGILGPKHQPRLERRDYVENSNNSYWLANPKHPLTGLDRIIGSEGTDIGQRPRLALRMIQERLAGTDGLGPKGFTLRNMQRMFFSDRNNSAEFARDSVVAGCRASGRADLAQACDVLANWDLRGDLDSRGEVLWREFWKALGTPPWTIPWDATKPLETPAGLNGSSSAVLDALSAAVADLKAKGIALDTPLGALQGTDRGSLRIPIPGCTDPEGCFNVITSDRDDQGRYDPFTGSSFIMTAAFKGRGKPTAQALLSYSQSENPRSKHFADQTKLFSAKQWLPMRFTDRQIRRDPAYTRKVVSARR